MEELNRFSDADFADLAGLMREMNGQIELSREALERMLADENSHLYVVRSEAGRIVGCACLCIFHEPFRTNGSVESVVVSSSCRGRGLGRELVQHVIAEASRMRVEQLHLTSSPHRIAANALYQKLGFVRKETNCYVFGQW